MSKDLIKEKLENNETLTEEDWDILLDENPSLSSKLKAIASEVELKDPRIPPVSHKRWISKAIHICIRCETCYTDYLLMSWDTRLSAYVRTSNLSLPLSPEFEGIEIKENLFVSRYIPCPFCREVLEKTPKNKIIERLLMTEMERDKFALELQRKYLSGDIIENNYED